MDGLFNSARIMQLHIYIYCGGMAPKKKKKKGKKKKK
jgi:hypothetical protein